MNSQPIGLPKSIGDLQTAQQKYNELYDAEILKGGLHEQLKVLVLRFLVCASNIESFADAPHTAKLENEILRAISTCISCANAMNFPLHNSSYQVSRILDNSEMWLKNISDSEAVKHILLTVGGRMAKVLEAHDHMDFINAREEMTSLVPELLNKLLALYFRWSKVDEEKVV